jgi:hypothetical protein
MGPFVLRHIEIEHLRLFEEIFKSLSLSYENFYTHEGEKTGNQPFFEDFPERLKVFQGHEAIFELT